MSMIVAATISVSGHSVTFLWRMFDACRIRCRLQEAYKEQCWLAYALTSEVVARFAGCGTVAALGLAACSSTR